MVKHWKGIPLPKPSIVEVEKEEEVENLEENDEPEERLVENEVKGETEEPEKDNSTNGEIIRRPGKEHMIEEAIKQPLPTPYCQRLKKDKQETQS